MTQAFQDDSKQPRSLACNLAYIKQIMCAQLTGKIVLPHGLGLNKASYQALTELINDKDLMVQEIQWNNDENLQVRERASVCSELFALKAQERDELIALLQQHQFKQVPLAEQMAIIVATACLTNFHLWQSLGLETRTQLGELIKLNFPTLYSLNTENMRWKRFFYRQMCAQGGDYICKSPSCTQCKSYAECFA